MCIARKGGRISTAKQRSEDVYGEEKGEGGKREEGRVKGLYSPTRQRIEGRG
jgi:hypothetical protein